MQHAAGWTGARRLLKRVRDMMAGSGAAEQRLDQIVKIIAADMVAEVCSIYLRRAGELLELFATEGLNPAAVHRTRLRVGEGLIGDIAAHARPLALADAQSHPNFAYRPETGEEIYHSLMGVPLLHGGRVMGVLAVQNRTRRNYTEEEIETLETVAMVLAELAASGELIGREELVPSEGAALSPVRVEGQRLNPGLAIGVAVLHRPRIEVSRLVAENPEIEMERLGRSIAALQSAIDALIAAPDLADAGEHRQVLETYRMFAEDRGWIARIGEAIRAGLTAEASVQRVQNEMHARLGQASDPYIRERLADLEDLAQRLLQHLTGTAAGTAAELPDEAVIIARNMGPAELLDYDRRKLRAVVLEEGSPTSHVAIIARALDIPMVGRANGILDRIVPLVPIVVDGTNALVYVRPGEDVMELVARSVHQRAGRGAELARLREMPTVTRDGVKIALHINAGLMLDLDHLDETGADGVGLFRTEIPFMVRSSYPDLGEQIELYRRVLDRVGDRPLVFRTLDIGGDKILPYLDKHAEENPAMGWRAIRIGLDRPQLLLEQIRAMIRAADGRPLNLMFPMVAEVAEFDTARRLVELEIDREKRRKEGRVPAGLRIGAMIEVPAMMLQLPALLERADFVSVGTNDLAQFLFASDRGNPHMSGRYDVLSPVVLSALRDIAHSCAAKGIPATVCGEMASQPLEAMALIGAGFRSLSLTPSAYAAVKSMVLALDAMPLGRVLEGLRQRAEHSLRPHLTAWARDHAVPV